MLVRFLSYAASVIGARRYKPLLISCLALVFSITSISVLVATLSGGTPDAASKVGQAEKQSQAAPSSSTDLGGLEKKETKTENNPAVTSPSAQGSAGNENKAPNGPTSSVSVFDIALNTATVSLSPTSNSALVAVTASDSKISEWGITSDAPVPGLNVRIEQNKDNPANAVIRLRLENAAPGTYQFTVTAKDAGRNGTASKTITVTVNS